MTPETREHEFIEEEQAATVRAAALEETLDLVRDQLVAANQRADRLEGSLEAREIEYKQL